MLIVLGLRLGRSKEEFERQRDLSWFNHYFRLYPICLWVGPPLLLVGSVLGLICLLQETKLK